VLDRPCPECRFDPAAVDHTEVADRIRGDATDWVRRLGQAGAERRRQPTVWSTLEYGCHIRDVHRIFNHRVELMLTEDEPQVPQLGPG